MRLKLYRGKWAVVWRANGKTHRRSLHTADRDTAERRFRDIKIERPGDTVGEIIASYLEEKRQARSHGSMLTSWRALQSTFAHLRPDQISRALCRSYAAMRHRGGVKDGTIIKDLGLIKAAVRWAGKAAGAVFEMPAAPAPRERYLTREEFSKLVEACQLPHIRLFVIMALSTAARASALLELTWDRVKFAAGTNGQIQLAKGEGRRKGRATVPMTDSARAALGAAYKSRETEFVIEWGGKPVKSVKRSFATACAIAGVADVTPHVLRHSAAVWMVESGVSLEEVGQFLGHTDLRVTYRVYARFSPGYLRKAAAALEL